MGGPGSGIGKLYPSRDEMSRGRALAHLALLVLATLLVFSNTFRNGYHLDDFPRIVENPELERVLPLGRHFLDPRTSSAIPHVVQYRPLLPISLAVNRALADALRVDRLAAYHAGNLLIHLLSVLLAYLYLRELALRGAPASWPASRRDRLAFAAALLYAVHPVSGVPVNYLCARDLLQMQLFLLAALLLYARMRRRGESWWGWGLVVLLLALSILSKTNTMTAPLVFLLFEFVLAGERLRDWRPWARALPAVLVAAGFALFTRLVLGFSDADQLLVERSSRFEFPLTQLRLHLFFYMRNFVWPFRMRPLPLLEPVRSWLDPGMLLGAAFVAATLAAAWRLRRRVPLASFAIGAYWAMLTLEASVLPLRLLATDYRQYAPLPYLSLALCLALFGVPAAWLRRALLAAVFLYLAASSLWMNRVWRTEETLWRQSVRYGGESVAHQNYALAVTERDPALAERHLHEALRIYPWNIRAHINLGLLQMRQGRQEEGLATVRKAVAIDPTWAVSHFWLSRALAQLGRRDEAADESALASDLDPRGVQYAYQAAYDAQARGRYADCLRFLERVHAVSDHRELSRFLEGWSLQKLGRVEEAVAAYRLFLEETPRYVQARFNLAYALMGLGRWAEAAAEFERTLALKPDYHEVHLHLARCYRELGREADARRESDAYEARPR